MTSLLASASHEVMPPFPSIRVRSINDAPTEGPGAYGLYWMTAQRRATHNFALDHALDHARDHARELKRPLHELREHARKLDVKAYVQRYA